MDSSIPGPQLTNSIIERITLDLSSVIGPMARVVLSEKIYQLASETEVPIQKIPDLIELSSLDIKDANRRTEFQRVALKHYERFKKESSFSTIPGAAE
jgi:hypothetical protein